MFACPACTPYLPGRSSHNTLPPRCRIVWYDSLRAVSRRPTIRHIMLKRSLHLSPGVRPTKRSLLFIPLGICHSFYSLFLRCQPARLDASFQRSRPPFGFIHIQHSTVIPTPTLVSLPLLFSTRLDYRLYKRVLAISVSSILRIVTSAVMTLVV